MAIATTNPATGETVREFDSLTSSSSSRRSSSASWDAFQTYRDTTFEQRAGWMRAAADILDAEIDRLAELATLEMGKTFAAAKAEVGEVRAGLPLVRRPRRRAPRRPPVATPADAPENARVFTRYQPLGPGAGDHAVELPVLAGLPLRRARR